MTVTAAAAADATVCMVDGGASIEPIDGIGCWKEACGADIGNAPTGQAHAHALQAPTCAPPACRAPTEPLPARTVTAAPAADVVVAAAIPAA
jgi:hypothetical protein